MALEQLFHGIRTRFQAFIERALAHETHDQERSQDKDRDEQEVGDARGRCEAVDEAECERDGDGFEEEQRDDIQMVLQEKPHDPSPSMERR